MLQDPDRAVEAAFDLADAGNRPAAAEACRRVLEAHPGHFLALYLLGSLYGEMGRLAEGAELLKAATAVEPGRATSYLNLATILLRDRRHEEALRAIDHYLGRMPEDAEAHAVRSAICLALRRYEAALAAADRAIYLKPGEADGHLNRGNALRELRRFDEAVASYEDALALGPSRAEVHNNLGLALADQGRLDQAVARFGQAIERKPGYSAAFRNRSLVLGRQRRLGEALADLDRAIALDPDLEEARGERLLLKRQVCDWSDGPAELTAIEDGMASSRLLASPFVMLAASASSALQLKAAKLFCEAEMRVPEVHPPPPREPPMEDRIRIGYFSADLRDHPVAHAIADLIERHDRKRFDVVAFSFGAKAEGDMRRRLEAAFDRFFHVSSMADPEVALMARELRLDIAVDLMGYTRDARPRIFAHRAAPIQAGFLGYAGTMGADFIDYVVADAIVAPPGREAAFQEKIVRLPGSYLPNDALRPIAEQPPDRAGLGLPEEGFVFCSFNNSYKITPDRFDIWMRILRSVEGSVLWLREDNPAATANLKREAAARAVDSARLVFAGRMELPAHLARHRQADLFLDTLPYNAHSTAADALYAGLPVLTQAGEAFAGRVAASLLQAAGLPELVTGSEAEYEELAIALAHDRDRLGAIREKLAANRLTEPLFDGDRYARNLEKAYAAMIARHQAGLPPDHIDVKP